MTHDQARRALYSVRDLIDSREERSILDMLGVSIDWPKHFSSKAFERSALEAKIVD